MSEAEVETRFSRQKLIMKAVKAAFITADSGLCRIILWFLILNFLGEFFQQLSPLFWVLVCALLFFTFAIRITENTIYQYVFVILRAFFLIVYILYSTNFGVLTVNVEQFTFTVEFIPLLSIMVLINFFINMWRAYSSDRISSSKPKRLIFIS